MENVENIIDPYSSINEINEELIKLYIEDYGKSHEQKIRNNFNEIIYFFYSTPDYNLEYIIENQDKIKDERIIKRALEEYKDFESKKRIIEEKISDEFNNRIMNFYTNQTKYYLNGYWDLDIESYSYNSKSKLEDERVYEEVKSNIKRRRKKYLEECEKRKLEPITSWENINSLLDYKRKLLLKEYTQLVKKTMWGKRITKELFFRYKKYIKPQIIAEILLANNPGRLMYKGINSRRVDKICCVPIIQNISKKNVDLIFLHENRHVAESGIETVGIKAKTGEYNILNEINTQKNAILDNKHLETIFEKDNKSKYLTTYDMVFPYTEGLFEDEKEIINEAAVSNNTHLIENEFGRCNLLEYDSYLTMLHKEVCKDIRIDLLSKDSEKQKRIIKSMKDNNML